MGVHGAKDVSPKRRAIIQWHLKHTRMSQREIAKKVSVSQTTVAIIKKKMDRGEDVLSSKRGICDGKRATIQRYLKEGRMSHREIARKVLVTHSTVGLINKKMEMAPRVQSKLSRYLNAHMCRTKPKNKFNRKHTKSTSNKSNKKYEAQEAAEELRVNAIVPVSQQSERFNTSGQERTAVREKSPAATTSSQTQPIAKRPPSMTNVADTPTTSTNRTDATQDVSIYFSTKSDGHRFRSPIRGRLRNSLDQSSVNDNAENDDAIEINDTVTTPSTIYFPDGTRNVNSSEGLFGSSRDEESSKTLVENTDASASSKDSLVVMAGSSRFDSISNKMSPILRRRPIRHERKSSERLRRNTDFVDEPMPRDVRAPFTSLNDEKLITSTAPSVSLATILKRKCAQLLRKALQGFIEKFEKVIEMLDEDQVI